jgi:hypothetical protein
MVVEVKSPGPENPASGYRHEAERKAFGEG